MTKLTDTTRHIPDQTTIARQSSTSCLRSMSQTMLEAHQNSTSVNRKRLIVIKLLFTVYKQYFFLYGSLNNTLMTLFTVRLPIAEHLHHVTGRPHHFPLPRAATRTSIRSGRKRN